MNGVPALFAEILCEGVACPHRLQARILFDSRLRDHRARISIGRRTRLGLASAVTRALLVDRAAVVIVLQREILAPNRRVLDFFGELHDAEEWIPRLLLVPGKIETRRIVPIIAPAAASRREQQKRSTGGCDSSSARDL
jgi:hypothetical protein